MSRSPSERIPGSGDAERVISFAFFLSGASGLIFEVVWFHRCGLVFGNTIWSTSIVLSSFMGGLAIGNALVARHTVRIRDFLRTYAALEIVVAVTGLLLTAALASLPTLLVPLTSAFADSPRLMNLVRLVAAFLLLVVPTTAMGATLPVLAGASCSVRPGFGRALGRLYGWNTLGAVVGAVGTETLLIPAAGIFGSAVVASLLNVVAAAVTIAAAKVPHTAGATNAGTSRAHPVEPLPGWQLLASTCLAGGGLMALEVIWFRMLSMFVVNTTLAMSLMLAAVLSAIGLGGLAASRWISRNPSAHLNAPAIAFAMACAIVLSYTSFASALGGDRPADWYRVLWLACWLTFPASLLSGVLFTLLGHGFRSSQPSDTVAAGRLLLANTIGAMAGPLVAGFVLLPAVGIERSLVGIAVLLGFVGVAGLVTTRGRAKRGTAWTAWAAGVCAVALLSFFPFGLMAGTYFVEAARAHTADGSEIIASKEGLEETIFVTRKSWRNEDIYHRLVTNGFSMTATAVPGKRYMREFVYLPLLLKGSSLNSVLVICYGVGVTAGAVTDIPSVRSIDVVEISRDIVAMSDFIYPPDRRPLADPRVKLHLEDGRFFLQNTSARFDLITGEPPPPLTPGTVNIYTREHFQLIHDHLAEGGIATYWLPVGRREGVDHTAIIRAFCDVFENCSLWNGTPNDLMLMGSRGSLPTSVALPTAWHAGVLGSHLREAGFEQPEQLAATFLGDAAYLNGLTSDSRPVVDNYPRRLWLSSSATGSQLLFDRGGSELDAQVLDPSRARRAFEASSYVNGLWPEEFRRRVLPFFDVQRAINRVLGEGAHVLGQIEDLHLVIKTTSLRTLAYWLLGMGNHPILDRVDSLQNDGTGEIEYIKGLRSLVDRNFSGAAQSLTQARAKGVPGTRPLLAYVLSLSGDIDGARQVARGAESGSEDQRHFWEWMRVTFGVSP